MTLARAPDARIGSDRRVATKIAAEDTSREHGVRAVVWATDPQ